MKTINKCIAGVVTLAGIVALPFMVRSCSIAQSNRPYMQEEYKGAHYSFANNGIVGHTYKITLKDGTKLRCDDLGANVYNRDIIDSVIEYDRNGKILKVYKNKLSEIDENDEFLKNLTTQVNEARNFIRDYRRQQLKNKQSELLNKVKGEN